METTQGARILVVDDESSIRFFLQELLERDGHSVVAVDSGEAALCNIENDEFDLALIDLKLKGIGGTQVLTALHEQWPDTIAIMLTGHGSLESAVEALRHGAHDYLFKPCKTVELRESIRVGLLNRLQKQRQRELMQQLEQHLSSSLANVRATITDTMPPPNRSSGAPTPRPAPVVPAIVPVDEPAQERRRFLQQGSLIVDFARHVITMSGHLLELSPTEFALLAYLMSESPRVVSPQELVREAQGYTAEPWEARDIVRYYIYRIRQKIKEVTGSADVIQTVRGVGYTIRLE